MTSDYSDFNRNSDNQGKKAQTTKTKGETQDEMEDWRQRDK